jgi:hypothetical protein
VAGAKPRPPLTTREEGDFGVKMRRGLRGKPGGYPSPMGGVLEGSRWPGKACAGAWDGLVPKYDGGPLAERGDSVLLRRRGSDTLPPSGSVGFRMEWTPRSREGAAILQSSPGGAAAAAAAAAVVMVGWACCGDG